MDAEYHRDPALIRESLYRQVVSPVRWQACVVRLIADGCDTFWEFGPNRVLTGLMRKINRNAKAFLFAIVGAEHVLRLLPKGTHEYAKFVRPSELAQACRDAGLHVETTRGMEFNPLSDRYWLSDDTSVNYLFGCRLPAQ